jgi:ABC-type hemin transport system ATPase subunit
MTEAQKRRRQELYTRFHLPKGEISRSFTRLLRQFHRYFETRKVDTVMQLKKHGIPAIFISHRLEDIFEVCDRIFVLYGGKRVAAKETKDAEKEEIVRYMFMGTNGEPVEK